MTVSTFLVTFPNGRILYLGSWRHETHPTVVYEDELDSSGPRARGRKKTSRRRWKTAAGTVAQRAVLHAAEEILSENRLPPHPPPQRIMSV